MDNAVAADLAAQNELDRLLDERDRQRRAGNRERVRVLNGRIYVVRAALGLDDA